MASGHNNISLDLNDDDGRGFDQFAGKKSTYKEELYTSKIHYEKIPQELKLKAE